MIYPQFRRWAYGACALLTLVLAPVALAQTHSADTSGNFKIELPELLRVIQFFNVGEYSCNAATVDGYAPGGGNKSCDPHDSDYQDQNFKIALQELLRLIQFFNADGYQVNGSTADGFEPIFTDPEGEGEGVEGEGEGVEGEGEGTEGEPTVDPQLRVQNVKTTAGSTVALPILLAGEGAGVATLSFVISYDEDRAIFQGASPQENLVLAEKSLSVSEPIPGELVVTISNIGSSNLAIATGVLFNLNMAVSSGLDIGAQIGFFASAPSATNTANQNINVLGSFGRILIDSGGQPVPPAAAFTVTPLIGLPGTIFTFTDTSLIGTGTGTTWNWDFGDGSGSSSRNPTKAYELPGTYDVSLTVTTTDGSDTESKVDLITIVEPATILVDRDNVSGNENGLTWATAFSTIQAGIDAAVAQGGGEVWVAAGTYAEVRENTTGSVVLGNLVELYGGFAGSETERDQRNVEINVTTIDGSTARGGAPAYHVVRGGDRSRLDGFTITGGAAQFSAPAAPTRNGGGMFNNSVIVDVANCVFINNSADVAGGAMANNSATVRILNCEFIGNFAVGAGTENTSAQGGAVYCSFGTVTIQDSVFSGNIAQSTVLFDDTTVLSTAEGGALYMFNGTLNLKRCRFEENSALALGTGTLVVGENTLRVEPRARGGGIFTRFAALNADAVILSKNLAKANRNSSFALSCGGGLYNSDSIVKLTNALIVNNDTVDETNTVGGAAICNNYSASNLGITISNATIYGNDSDSNNFGQVGGVYSANCNPKFTNVLLWTNSGLDIGGINSIPSFNYCNVQDGVLPGNGNISANPLLVNVSGGDFRPLVSSPLVDAGGNTSTAALGSVVADIIGTPRPIDGTLTPRGDGSDYDIGAFEFSFN